jgi:hypothetical protein
MAARDRSGDVAPRGHAGVRVHERRWSQVQRQWRRYDAPPQTARIAGMIVRFSVCDPAIGSPVDLVSDRQVDKPRRAGFIVDPGLRGVRYGTHRGWQEFVVTSRSSTPPCVGTLRKCSSPTFCWPPPSSPHFSSGEPGAGSQQLGWSQPFSMQRSNVLSSSPPVSGAASGDAAKQARARDRDHLRDQRRIRGGTPDRVAVGY